MKNILLALAVFIMVCGLMVSVESKIYPRITTLENRPLVIMSTSLVGASLCNYAVGHEGIKEEKAVTKFTMQARCGVYVPGDTLLISKNMYIAERIKKK